MILAIVSENTRLLNLFANMADTIDKQATLLVKYKPGDSWKERMCTLSMEKLTIEVPGEGTIEEEIYLNAEHYVQESLNKKVLGAQSKAFVFSDFENYTYFSGENEAKNKEWLQAFQKAIVKIQMDDSWWLEMNQLNLSEEQLANVLDEILSIYMQGRGVTDPYAIGEEPTNLEEEAAIANLVVETIRIEEEETKEEEEKALAELNRVQAAAVKTDAAVKRLSVMPGSDAMAELEAEMKKLDELKEIERLAQADLEIAKAKESMLSDLLKNAEENAANLEKSRKKEATRMTRLPPNGQAPKPAEQQDVRKTARRMTRMPTQVQPQTRGRTTIIHRATAIKKKEDKKAPIKNRVLEWQKKLDERNNAQKNNVFSGHYDKSKAVGKGDTRYGKPLEGSKTEERAAKAAEWVNKEVNKLLSVIQDLGKHDEEAGGVTITFGALFIAYQDISDTLVGMLMRAKKRKQLHYPGQMLFQGAHDHVKITLT